VPIAIAHRGDPVAQRENTLPAFAAAVENGADMVELDLHRAGDGEIVVLHDSSLIRLWGVDQEVGDLDLAALADVGAGAVRIPTLRQVLDAVAMPLMVDFTGPEVLEGAVTAIREAGAMRRSLFVSGDIHALAELRDLAPEARLGLTWVDSEPPSAELIRQLGAEFWNPSFHLVTAERVAFMHALGLRVSTWTVDEPRDMARVVGAGVDAVVTNRIAELRRFLSGPDRPGV
jgi:glycerophosphoryl diester phosphodiesterase